MEALPQTLTQRKSHALLAIPLFFWFIGALADAAKAEAAANVKAEKITCLCHRFPCVFCFVGALANAAKAEAAANLKAEDITCFSR